MPETLSLGEGQKLVLLSQWLPRIHTTDQSSSAVQSVLAAIRHLGYVQIDTLSVVARAHHHTLWNRTRRYQPQYLERLLQQRKVFEYWSHAAAYLPMEDYRFSLPRKQAFAEGMRHWFKPNRRIMQDVLSRITAEGALRAQDFADKASGKTDMWDWKPAKQSLEQLFMEGKLMTLRRQGFQKVYDLAERVLPSTANTTMPSQIEYGCFLITRFLRANGLGTATEIAYQRSEVKPLVERCITQMLKHGEIIQVKVAGKRKEQLTPPIYHALPDSLELLNQALPRRRLQILSPFDNLLIQRKRVQTLFDFEYRIECYTPAHKRKYGYFSLPILWNGKLVARMDCKAERKTRTLIIRNFVSEPAIRKKEQLVEALCKELKHFAAFNQCERIVTEKLQDQTIQSLLNARLADHSNP